MYNSIKRLNFVHDASTVIMMKRLSETGFVRLYLPGSFDFLLAELRVTGFPTVFDISLTKELQKTGQKNTA